MFNLVRGFHVSVSSLTLLALKESVEFRSESKILLLRPVFSEKVAQKLAIEHFIDGRNRQALISSVSLQIVSYYIQPYYASTMFTFLPFSFDNLSSKTQVRKENTEIFGFFLKLAIRPVRFFSLPLCTIPKTLLFYSFIHGCQSKCMKPCL